MAIMKQIKGLQPIFSKIALFFYQHNMIIMAILVIILFVLIVLLIIYLAIKKPLDNILMKAADYMFSPSPKSVGLLGRKMSNFLSDRDKKIILRLFDKINNSYSVSIIINGKSICNGLDPYKLEETKNLSTFIMEKNALILVQDGDLSLVDKILQQLKSYIPLPSWIITVMEEKENLEDHKTLYRELGEIIKKHFLSPPNCFLIYYEGGTKNPVENPSHTNISLAEEEFTQSPILIGKDYQVDYSFLIGQFDKDKWKTGFNLLSRSFFNGFALEIQETIIKNLEENLQYGMGKNIEITALLLLIHPISQSDYFGNFSNFIYANRNTTEVKFLDNPRLRFIQKIYRIILVGTILYFLQHLLLSQFEYQKLIKLIDKGNQILFNQTRQSLGSTAVPEEEQLKIAREFVSSVIKVKLSHIKTIGQEENLVSLGQYFSKVYSSSIVNIYKRKINSLLQEIEDNTEMLIKTDGKIPDYSIKSMKDMPGMIHWQIMMEKIKQLDFLLVELRHMFSYDNNDASSMVYVEKRINSVISKNQVYTKGESKEIPLLIHKAMEKVQLNITNILDIMANSLMNKNILRKKQDLHRVLAAITADYVDQKQTVSFNTIEYLFQEMQEFIDMINTDFYVFLDKNQFSFPINIEEDINFLTKKSYFNQYIRDRMEKSMTAKLQNYKAILFNLNHTFLSSTNLHGNREEFLNSGDTNINLIYEALKTILSDEFVQILKNSVPERYKPITQQTIDQSSVIWDLKKIESMGKIVEVYSTFYEKWNSFNNNMFLFVLNKLLNNNFIKLIQWTMDQAVILDKLDKANIQIQRENLRESMEIFKEMIRNNGNILNYVPLIKKVVYQQMKIIAKLLLDSFNSLWFTNIHPENWNGNEPILKTVAGVSDPNLLNKVFVKDFSILDNTLTSEIIPYIDIVVEQKILIEQELPYEISTLGDIMNQISLYKNQEDNDIKNLEQQLLDYDKMQAYDLFKLENRKCSSSGNIFEIISDNLHNVLVQKAKTTVRINKINEYNNIVEFFNNRCSNKVPFVSTGVDSVTLEDLNTLKNMTINLDQIILILQGETDKLGNTKKINALAFLSFLQEFFSTVAVGTNYARVKFTMELQYEEEGTANDAVIMRWHTYFGEKESHNNKLLENISIGHGDRCQILMDIAKDSSIEVVEYKKIIPLERGCLIFSDNHWGIWRFIGSYYFKDNGDSIILAVKVPIIVCQSPLEQEWIITYIKVSKLPFFPGKAQYYK